MVVGLSLLNRGKILDALPYFESVAESAKRSDDAQTHIWGLLGRVESCLWLNDDPRALLTDVEKTKSLLSARSIGVNDHIRTFGLSARVNMRMGNEQLAWIEAQKVLDLTAQAGFFIPYSRAGYQGAVDAFLSLWEKADDKDAQEALAAAARQGLKISRQMGRTYPVIAPRAWMQQGRYDWLSGKQNKAHKAWRKSIELARQLGMPHEEGLALFEYGRHLTPDDPDRTKHLQRAIELFSEVEAAYYLDLAQRELRGEG